MVEVKVEKVLRNKEGLEAFGVSPGQTYVTHGSIGAGKYHSHKCGMGRNLENY